MRRVVTKLLTPLLSKLVRVREFVEELQLLDTDIKVLQYLVDRGEATLPEIHREVGMSRSTVWKVLNRLESRGIVIGVENPDCVSKKYRVNYRYLLQTFTSLYLVKIVAVAQIPLLLVAMQYVLGGDVEFTLLMLACYLVLTALVLLS